MEEKPNINRYDLNTEKQRKRRTSISGALLHRAGLFFKGIVCIFFMILGIFLIIGGFGVYDPTDYNTFVTEIINEILALGITCLLYYFVFKSIIKNKILLWIVLLLVYSNIAYFTENLGNYSVLAFQEITGLFGIITAVVLFLNVIRQIRDRVWFLRSLIWGILYLLAGLDMLLSINDSEDFSFIIGFYVFSYAFNIFWEGFKSFFSFSSKKSERRRKVVTLPTVISAFLPIGFFANLNKTVKSEDYDKNLYMEDDEEIDEDKKTDLTIYIHTRAGLMPGFGHVDISFEDKVYCYGNYDQDTWLFGGFISDGVLATTTPENHIKNALTNDKKILIAYDLKISEKTKVKIKKQLDKMFSKAYRWRPKAELAELGEIEGVPEDYDDVASIMYREENTELYKFEKGSPYKTYYLLGQNCAMVANEIVGHSGIKLLRLNRIVTPGSYLEYLDHLYKMRHTIVVDRHIYMLNNNGKPYLLTKQNEEELAEKVK